MKQFVYRILQSSGLIIVSIGLLYGGIAILNTNIPFWNLVYGIPAVFLGILTSLITFNELTKTNTQSTSVYHEIPCKVCRKMTLVPMLIESAVCTDCQYKMALRLQMGIVIFFVVLALPVTYHLSQQAQDIRQNARETEASPFCDSGSWDPTTCQCGKWRTEIICDQGEFGRSCGNEIYCCTPNLQNWTCTLKP